MLQWKGRGLGPTTPRGEPVRNVIPLSPLWNLLRSCASILVHI